MSDIESKQAPTENLEGYEDFSKFIASDVDLSIYRRFGVLGARNLLYLQAELQVLEAQLQKLDDDDRNEIERSSGNRRRDIQWAAKSWESFYQQSSQQGRQKEKMAIVLRLREAMKEYGKSNIFFGSCYSDVWPLEEALLRRSRILSLEAPHKGILEAFGNWFRQRRPFLGSGWSLLDDETELVALKAEVSPDRMTNIIRHLCGYMIRERRHKYPESWGPVYYFPLSRVTWIVSVLSILIAGVLLLGAVVTLYYVQSPGQRLGIAGVFIGFFVASVGLLTNAKRSEIFTATAT